jgi:hypothetical protein
MSYFFAALLMLAGFLPSAFAQEGESEASTVAPGKQIARQGEFAVLFANKLGLNAGITHPLTAAEAVNLLIEAGISPFGGWNLEKPLTSEDLARMIVQSLDALDEIDVAEKDNPQTTAYTDYLKRVYDVDIQTLDPSDRDAVGRMVGKRNEPSAAGQFADSNSSDPLRGRGEEGEIDELNARGKSSGVRTLVTTEEVDRVINATTPTQGGGDSGQVDDDTQDTTPSAPTPA